ncbi:MAG: PhoU domain-containing protein [Mycoplasmoidaceae bacterium]
MIDTNYDIVIETEDKIFKEFQEYVSQSILVHHEIWNIIFKKRKNEADLERIDNLEEEANFLQKNLIDDTVWAISKAQPRANHLRYIIALIYSIKDIERLIDTGFEIFRATNYTKDYDFNEFKTIVSLYLKLLIKLEKYMGVNYKENIERIKLEKNKFDEKFYSEANNISHELKHQKIPSKISYQCSSIIKNINIASTHYFNAFLNFKYIKHQRLSSKKTKSKTDKL